MFGAAWERAKAAKASRHDKLVRRPQIADGSKKGERLQVFFLLSAVCKLPSL
jgi:hypothetical protein